MATLTTYEITLQGRTTLQVDDTSRLPGALSATDASEYQRILRIEGPVELEAVVTKVEHVDALTADAAKSQALTDTLLASPEVIRILPIAVVEAA